jgi:hypothetical protein
MFRIRQYLIICIKNLSKTKKSLQNKPREPKNWVKIQLDFDKL